MLTVKLEIGNAGPKQTEIARKASEALQLALNHESLKQRIISAAFSATWNYDGASDAQLSRRRILDILTQGIEVGSEVDFEIDLVVHLTALRRGIVGSTSLGKQPVRTSFWYINECIRTQDVKSLASHFIHEWMHVAGFYHRGGNTARGDVAYVLGEIVFQILSENLQGVTGDPENTPS